MASSGRLRERLAQATLELVRTPSVTGSEREIAHHIERWAQALPNFGRDDVIRHGNAVIVGTPDDMRPCVALVGHLDTVPAHDGDPEPAIAGDRVVGLGASDMKGGIAVLQALCAEVDVRALPFTLMIILYDREEGPYEGNGLGVLLDAFDMLHDIDLAVVMEPTDNTLQLGCLGSLQARLSWFGKSAHSARPWEGDNAIHKAGPLIERLRTTPPKDVAVEGLIFRESMNITAAGGGRARNVIPDRFEINLNYRFAPVGDPRQAALNAERTVRALAPEADVKIVDLAPPGPVPVQNPMLDHLRRHASAEVRPKQAWTDVARLAAHDIDAVNFGPGSGAQAHQAGEWVSIDALVRSYEMLARTLSVPLAD
ncbi:MAG: succinyl-diaminopimelate desuccinylase [Deltaproteobacteria bacterium]|nr:succinyl-diaminopimelate desuccinylase [Deltaproteobacteria bacterium]